MSDTEEYPIPDGYDDAVARLAARTISGWRVDASRVNSIMQWWTSGSRAPQQRPMEKGWILASPESVASRLRFEKALDVHDETVEAIRQMMPWIDSSYDLVSEWSAGETYRNFTFWQSGGYDPVPEGTYQLECWYAWADLIRNDAVVFGWKVLTDGPALGRIVHQELPLDAVRDRAQFPQQWRRVKSLVRDVLDIYEPDYPFFPGFSPVRAEGKRILADVMHDRVEEFPGAFFTRERVHNERRWIDPSRATFLTLVP